MDGSFVFYESFMDAVEEIPEDLQLEALKALIKYGLHGEVKRHPANPFATVILTMAKPVIDANAERRKNGAKGGRPPKTNGYENEKPMVIDEETVGNDISESAKPNEDEDVDANGDVDGEGDEEIAPAPTPKKSRLGTYGKFANVMLTEDEAAMFKEEHPDTWKRLIDNLSLHIASTGKHYQNHFATLEKWAMQDKERQQPAPQVQPGSALDYLQRKDDMMDVFMDL